MYIVDLELRLGLLGARKIFSLKACMGTNASWCVKCFLYQDRDSPPPSVVPAETERETEIGQQLKQANDTAARLQDKLRQAEDKERQLQMEMGKTKYEVSEMKMEKKEFDYTKQRTADVSEQQIKGHDYITFIAYSLICFRFTTMIIISMLKVFLCFYDNVGLSSLCCNNCDGRNGHNN